MNQLSDNQAVKSLPVTPEEDVEFDLLERRLNLGDARSDHIQRMVAVAGTCRTTSLSGICTRLFDAGCQFNK